MTVPPTPGEVFSLENSRHADIANPAANVGPRVENREDRATSPAATEFSLVLGGPLFQLCRRAHLSGDALELVYRRVLAISLFAWLPLLFFSALERHAIGGAIKIPFLHDIEANVRFLVALPVLIIAELVVHERISPLVRRFVERRIVVTEDLPAFDAAVHSALRGRDSIASELGPLVLVYTLGLLVWRSQVALAESTWYAMPEAKQLHLTLAGYWYVFVSIPVFQFILLRWYVRLAIWFRLLWQISRLHLHLVAAHPDRAGGIGFLGNGSYAFGPILFVQGGLLAGFIATRVLYEGRGLLSFKMEAVGFVGFFVLVILGPLVMFAPLLDRTKRKGSNKYGLLANRYLLRLDEEWKWGGASEASELPGTEEIRPVGNVEKIYSAVHRMRLVPFGAEDITRLAAATAAPLLPLALTIFSVADLVKLLIKTVFR